MTSTQSQLRSQRLVLEPLEARHAPLLYESLLDERIYRFIPQDPPVSEQALLERYRRLEARQSPDGQEVWLNWAMRLDSAGTYIGTLEATVYPEQTAYIAYTVFPPYQGNGYATEGVRLMLDHLDQSYQIPVIAALIDTRNSRSISPVERLGFGRVATERDADFFKGAPSDEYRYELRSE